MPDHPTLDERPEAFDGLRMNRADDVLPGVTLDRLVRVALVQAAIANPFVRAEQAHAVRDGFVDEIRERRSLGILKDAGDHVALAMNSADDDAFTRGRTAGANAVAALVLMPVLGAPAITADGSGESPSHPDLRAPAIIGTYGAHNDPPRPGARDWTTKRAF